MALITSPGPSLEPDKYPNKKITNKPNFLKILSCVLVFDFCEVSLLFAQHIYDTDAHSGTAGVLVLRKRLNYIEGRRD